MYRNILLVNEPVIKILFNPLFVFSVSCLFSDELKAHQRQQAQTKQNMHGGESASTSKIPVSKKESKELYLHLAL